MLLFSPGTYHTFGNSQATCITNIVTLLTLTRLGFSPRALIYWTRIVILIDNPELF